MFEDWSRNEIEDFLNEKSIWDNDYIDCVVEATEYLDSKGVRLMMTHGTKKWITYELGDIIMKVCFKYVKDGKATYGRKVFVGKTFAGTNNQLDEYWKMKESQGFEVSVRILECNEY